MYYHEVMSMLTTLLGAGGFPSDEPLDSTKRIAQGEVGMLPSWKVGVYARALAEVGEWERAEAVARSISDEGDSAQALNSVIECLVKAGRVDEAEAVAYSISTRASEAALINKVLALDVVALGYLKRGSTDRVMTILRVAEETVRRVTRAGYVKAARLWEMAETWEGLGDRVRSLGLWHEASAVAKESISRYRAGGQTDVDSFTVLKMIIVSVAKAGEPALARAVADSIDSESFSRNVERIVGEIEQEAGKDQSGD